MDKCLFLFIIYLVKRLYITRGIEYELRRFKSIYHYLFYDSKYFLYGNKRANDFNYLTSTHSFLIVTVILKLRGKKVTFSQPHCFIIQRHYKTEKEGNRVYKRCKRTQNNTFKDKYLMSMIRFYFCVYFTESLLFPYDRVECDNFTRIGTHEVI